jgi:hypothetical protein
VAQPESFVANASFYQMLAAAGVHKIALDCRLTAATPTATTTAGSGVASITVLCEPEPVTATVFIDASYDGEVMVAVGNVDYTAGREAASQYNESLGGARVPTKSSVVVDALRDDGTILKYVQNMSTLAAPGEADDALMAFQHRMCISGDDDRLPWKKPKGYVYNKYIYKKRKGVWYFTKWYFTNEKAKGVCRGEEEHAQRVVVRATCATCVVRVAWYVRVTCCCRARALLPVGCSLFVAAECTCVEL